MRLLALLLVAAPASAQTLTERVEARLAQQGPGARFGLVVVDQEGRDIVAIAPDQRFVPASNTKIYTTATALALIGDVTADDAAGGASVRLEGRDVVLEGHGDARLSSAAECKRDCLQTLADAVAVRTRVVHDVIGDDTLFPDERWSPGMSWNNIVTNSGTGISALTLDNNEVTVEVTPGPRLGAAATVSSGYYAIDNFATTGTRTDLSYDRMPGSDRMRVSGTVAIGGGPVAERLGVDDPARYAAWRLCALLLERGVRVSGGITVWHRALTLADNPAVRGTAPPARPPRPAPLAQLTAPPLVEDVAVTNKVSQNLHAELLLRRVGLVSGSGSIADGQAAVRTVLSQAGVERWRYDFADGSGMSNYNRVTPRGTVKLLRWTQAQPWGAAFRGTLAIGGVDGTLRRRFKGTPLEGKVFAKTGSLEAANALAGFMVAKSGRTLTFAAYANDVPGGASATGTIDAALNLIAAEN